MGTDNDYKAYLCISSVFQKEKGFKDYRFAAYRAAAELGFEVKRNPEDKGSTQTSFEYILKNRSPVFILIVGEKDSDMVRKECKIALDNCLPLLIFLKTRNSLIDEKTKNFVGDISKIAFDNECSTFADCETLYEDVKKRLTDYIDKRNAAHPMISSAIERAYEYCSELFNSAKKRVVVYQKTSSLILGPRDRPYEQKFYDQMVKWIKNRQEDMEFLHVFSRTQTVEALSSKEYNIKKYKAELLSLYKTYESDVNFTILSNDSMDNLSYVITDSDMLLVIPVGGVRYSITMPSYLMRNSEVTDIKYRLAGSSTRLSLADIRTMYKE